MKSWQDCWRIPVQHPLYWQNAVELPSKRWCTFVLRPIQCAGRSSKVRICCVSQHKLLMLTTHTHLATLQEYTNQGTTSTANGVCTFTMVLLASLNHYTNKNNRWTFTEEKLWRCIKHNIELLQNSTHPLVITDAANDLPHQLSWWWRHPVRWSCALMRELQ